MLQYKDYISGLQLFPLLMFGSASTFLRPSGVVLSRNPTDRTMCVSQSCCLARRLQRAACCGLPESVPYLIGYLFTACRVHVADVLAYLFVTGVASKQGGQATDVGYVTAQVIPSVASVSISHTLGTVTAQLCHVVVEVFGSCHVGLFMISPLSSSRCDPYAVVT